MIVSGTQVIAELTGCNKLLLNDEQELRKILSAGIKECGFTQVQITSHQFSPIGVTAIAIVSESHVAIHTFPEFGHVSIDAYHCSEDSTPLYRLLNFLKKALSAQEVKSIEISRGHKLSVQHRVGG
jgi:S-adenosylmethionine decarboxylase proenzyme